MPEILAHSVISYSKTSCLLVKINKYAFFIKDQICFIFQTVRTILHICRPYFCIYYIQHAALVF